MGTRQKTTTSLVGAKRAVLNFARSGGLVFGASIVVVELGMSCTRQYQALFRPEESSQQALNQFNVPVPALHHCALTAQWQATTCNAQREVQLHPDPANATMVITGRRNAVNSNKPSAVFEASRNACMRCVPVGPARGGAVLVGALRGLQTCFGSAPLRT